MGSVKYSGTTVDRCADCGGIWFDVFEAEDLVEADGGTSVDTGNAIKGMQMNKIHDIKCPRCAKQMQTVSDREDPLLKFEVCTDCHGYFLDAGELRDMAHVTPAEKISENLFEKIKQFIFGFQSLHMRDIPRDK
jgi:Zn-finger nucleic acid-binding protein